MTPRISLKTIIACYSGTGFLPGASCSITVYYVPGIVSTDVVGGTDAVTLQITTNAGVLTVPVTGMVANSNIGYAVFSSPSLDFGDIQQNTPGVTPPPFQSETLPIGLTNDGGVALNITNMSVMGTNGTASTDFQASMICDNGSITSAGVSSGGSMGYRVGDTGTITGGTDDATYIIDSVDSNGAVITFTITDGGTGYSEASGLPTVNGLPQPGSGTGFFVFIGDTGGVNVPPCFLRAAIRHLLYRRFLCADKSRGNAGNSSDFDHRQLTERKPSDPALGHKFHTAVGSASA